MQATIQGMYINYEVYGEGPPILCLHGWNENGKVFFNAIVSEVFTRVYCVCS